MELQNGNGGGGGGSGDIVSINGDTTPDQFLVVGTAGSDFNISDDLMGTHTFNLPTASVTNRGALSSDDWITFNSKQNAIEGLDTQVLFFDGDNNPAGDSLFTFNKTTHVLTLGKDLLAHTLTIGLGLAAVADNTALGVSALSSNTIGSEDTAVGYFALKANTTGYNNTAVGTQALQVNTTGVGNTAVGFNTLTANIGGSNNTAVGQTSLASNTTGTNNVAVGIDALNANTSGANNTAVGTEAMAGNILGNNNTAVGEFALFNSTGDNNTAIGDGALYTTTGTGNVGVGISAGFYETGSNSFYVNNQDRVNTAGDKAKSLLYGTFNATNTSQTLSINAGSVFLPLITSTTTANILYFNSVTGLLTYGALPGSFSGFANPTASITLSTQNGVATTAMRSDAAPALSQAIAPTWTGVHTFTPAARSSGSASYFTINDPADTGITAATESKGINIVGSTRTWVDGTTTTQREYFFGAPTYNKTTATATFTNLATLAVSGAPTAGAGVTFTHPWALWVQGGNSHFGSQIGATQFAIAGTGAEFVDTNNTTGGQTINVQNTSNGTSAFSGFCLNNDQSVDGGATTHFAGIFWNSSTYSDTTFGTAFAVASQVAFQNTDGPVTISAQNATGYINFLAGGSSTTNEVFRLTTSGWNPRVTTTNAPGATPSTNTNTTDIANFTGLAAAITSMTTNLTGTAANGQKREFRFTDNGTARAITWGASFASTGNVPLPTTTVASIMLRVGFEWNSTSNTWDCIAIA